MRDNLGRDAPEHDLLDSGAAVGRHHNQIHLILCSFSDDLTIWNARLDRLDNVQSVDDIGKIRGNEIVQ